MTSKSNVIWTIKELSQILRERQLNKFDCNIGVSGKRGNGKSTLLFKIFSRFKNEGFKQEKHQVYERDHVINLLSNYKFSFCWDDEAINSGYKREFQLKGQKELIKIVTNFRDSFNIYASALPFFYSLDKDLRELIFIHIHIIERGIAVILMPISDQIHSSDPWDTKYNIKVEEKENKRMERNPNLKFRYHRLSTFAGYLFFGDMTKQQRERYERIKREKRAKSFNISGEPIQENFNDKLYKQLIDGKLTKDFIIRVCLMERKKYSTVSSLLNRMLKDNGMEGTVKDFLLDESNNKIHSKLTTEIDDLIPQF